MEPGEFDLVGFAVGVVDRARILPAGVRAGRRRRRLRQPRTAPNGYTLARKALLERSARRLDDPAWRGAHHTLGDELLRPERDLRARDAEAPRARRRCTRSPTSPAAASPTTSRGCSGRTATRSSPAARGTSRASSPRSRPPGDVADDEMEQVFNLGLGMLAVASPEDRLDTLDAIRSAGHDAWLVGEIVEGRGRVRILR